MTSSLGPTGPYGQPPAGKTRDPKETREIADRAATDFLSSHPAGGGTPIAVVIPALNEEESLADAIKMVPERLSGLEVETILVDDGSRDRTSEVAAESGALVARLPINIGQGAAFKLGYRLARARGARFIATADADGQFDPRELPPFIEMLLADEADFVNGSRRLGHTYNTDTARNVGVVVFARVISVLTGTRITDPANGLRAFKAEVTEAVTLRQAQYQASEMLISSIANGFRVKELPVTMYERAVGESRKGSNLRYGYNFSKVILTTWWAMRPTARLRVPKGKGLWRSGIW